MRNHYPWYFIEQEQFGTLTSYSGYAVTASSSMRFTRQMLDPSEPSIWAARDLGKRGEKYTAGSYHEYRIRKHKGMGYPLPEWKLYANPDDLVAVMREEVRKFHAYDEGDPVVNGKVWYVPSIDEAIRNLSKVHPTKGPIDPDFLYTEQSRRFERIYYPLKESRYTIMRMPEYIPVERRSSGLTSPF